MGCRSECIGFQEPVVTLAESRKTLLLDLNVSDLQTPARNLLSLGGPNFFAFLGSNRCVADFMLMT